MASFLLAISLMANFYFVDCSTTEKKVVKIGMCDEYLHCRVQYSDVSFGYEKAPFINEVKTSKECK